MIIQVGNFNIRHSEGTKRFDLHIVKEGKSGKRKGKMIETALAYGIKIERCIDLIVQEKMEEEQGTIDLNIFLQEYKKANEELITKLIKLQENVN